MSAREWSPGAAPAEARAIPAETGASQARLNEIIAEIIRSAPGDGELITMALRALREHNWASGFTFKGARPRDEILGPAAHLETAGLTVRMLETKIEADAARARAVEYTRKHVMPEAAPGFARRAADEPALVYLITHAAYGAAKVGVTDGSGSRLAAHRREGWQLLAAFCVTAKTAPAIEAEVLRWWRTELGLPPHLRRDQMPQGGWTETAAVGRADLAATAARVCQMAVPASSLKPREAL